MGRSSAYGSTGDKNEGGVSQAQKIATWLATHGLPDYVVDRVRDQVKGNVNRFDPGGKGGERPRHGEYERP